MQVEVNMIPGKGEIRLTGQLGDVMKESAMTGISYVRSVADRYGIEPAVFTENDFHFIFRKGRFPRMVLLPELPWRRHCFPF